MSPTTHDDDRYLIVFHLNGSPAIERYRFHSARHSSKTSLAWISSTHVLFVLGCVQQMKAERQFSLACKIIVKKMVRSCVMAGGVLLCSKERVGCTWRVYAFLQHVFPALVCRSSCGLARSRSLHSSARKTLRKHMANNIFCLNLHCATPAVGCTLWSLGWWIHWSSRERAQPQSAPCLHNTKFFCFYTRSQKAGGTKWSR